ncbi:MAG: hypothetical protein MUF48_24020, partial [Pirellulaceae bacterium]|nr:hypothetical protein [Pirellulaceae bacterium]
GTDWYVGGLVGVNHGTISHCYSTDSVSGGEHGVGGLAGGNFGYIVTSYSSGSVSGTRWDVGGLVGHNEGSIATSYSSGSVSGTGYTVGGLVGYNVSHFTMPGSSFWDIQTSGQIISAGGTGKTTAEMQNIETFLSAGWDFIDEVLNGTCDYWQIAPGDYPRLRYAAGNRPLMPEGRGTVEQPYLIRDARDLGSVWFEPLAHYRLAQSIDLSGITWSMAVIPSFGGSFDGSGYVISHLHIQGANLLGLFGGLGPTASVSKLGLEAVAISGTGRAGGLAGGNEGNIVASYSNGSVSGTDYVIGGLVGSNNGSIVASCNSASVQGYSTVGGLVGENSFGHVAQCCSAGSVSGTDDVGGLVGQNWAGSIATSYSTGLVKGTHWYVGGLVGRSDGGGVTSGFWDTQTSGQTKSAGGTGKTTAEMQTAKTFLEASWDFVGETKNGTNDIWWILEGKDYPKLWWELTPKK